MANTRSATDIEVSVIVPNFNHGAYIERAIDRLYGQLENGFEIIVVDDGSTDNSLEILERLTAKYDKLRVVALGRNHGAIYALNRGLAESKGKYLNFAAADDTVADGIFIRLLDMLRSNPEAAFASAEALIYDVDQCQTIAVRPPVRPAQRPIWLDPERVARCFKKFDNWILTGAALVRRDYLWDAGGFDEALGSVSDGYAFRRLAFKYGCCFVPVVGLTWRVSSQGLSRSHAANVVSLKETLDRAMSMMAVDTAFPSWYPELFERRWRFGAGRLAALSRPMNREVLSEACARGNIGRYVLRASADHGGRLGSLVAICWLALQERPVSLAAVLQTAVARRLGY